MITNVMQPNQYWINGVITTKRTPARVVLWLDLEARGTHALVVALHVHTLVAAAAVVLGAFVDICTQLYTDTWIIYTAHSYTRTSGLHG